MTKELEKKIERISTQNIRMYLLLKRFERYHHRHYCPICKTHVEIDESGEFADEVKHKEDCELIEVLNWKLD